MNQKPAGTSGMLRKLKRFVSGLIVVALVGAGLYFGGRWQGQNLLADRQAEFDRQMQDAQTQIRQLQKQLADAENHTRLIRARTRLYQAVVDLDRQNFGTAQSRLSDAGDGLARVDADSANAEELHTLRRDIAGTPIGVETDTRTQQTQILGFISRLDDLISDINFPE